ncbi:hypothetical protein [Elizabethkingia anophelis]|uniref:hypothetical protein n=1 Tax=Elizabethkingia anophelis TaxID=1117645 RepID=UPI00320B4DD8
MKKHILFLILGISFLDIGQERGAQLALELSSPVEGMLNLVFPDILTNETRDLGSNPEITILFY